MYLQRTSLSILLILSMLASLLLPITAGANTALAGTAMKVEAESYTSMSGVTKSNTSDLGGSIKVISVDANDWMEYKVNFPQSGNYAVEYRVASAVANGKFELRQSDGLVLSTVAVGNTGGFGKFVNFPDKVYFPAGDQVIRIHSISGGLEFNHYTFTPVEVTVAPPSQLTVVSQASTSVTLGWSAPVDGAPVSYVISNNGKVIANSVTEATYTITGLTPAASYAFTVQAKNQEGYLSSVSNLVTATTAPQGVGNKLTYNGVEYTARIVKSFDFTTGGAPWVGANPTWDGHNASWEGNPGQNDNNSIALEAVSSNVKKSHVGSLGFTPEELLTFSGKENYLVRVQLQRWQPGGWGTNAGTFGFWSLETSAGIQWTDDRNDTRTADRRFGEVETFYFKGNNRKFVANSGTPKDLRLEWNLANWNNSQPAGTKVYMDNISITVFEDPLSARPAAPTQPIVDDGKDTFGWTDVPGYSGIANYEYSIDGGKTWGPATANPQPVGGGYYKLGDIQVRVKASAAQPPNSGNPLVSPTVFTITTTTPPPQVSGTVLWQLGTPNDSTTEFSSFANGATAYRVPTDWASRTDWKALPLGMKGSENGTVTITYPLDTIPEHGLQLTFKVLDAYKTTPQMAVFSNKVMAGLIQIAGVNNGAGIEHKFKQTYRLYVPKELLQAGDNELKLVVDRGLYADNTADHLLWYEWDYLKLEALNSPATEPLHGRYIHMGTMLANLFTYDQHVIRHLAPLTKWLGIAYSGNWMRTAYWSDTKGSWDPEGRKYLETLRDMNLAPMMTIYGGDWKNDPQLRAGLITDNVRKYYRDFTAKYGDLYQYLEVQNEPGLFGWSQKSILALTQMFREERTKYQPNLKIVAPGWAYWPSNGDPDGWERDPNMRRPIEQLSDLTNGHSYGGTGVSQLRGGSLIETLLVYPESNDGFPKEMAMSETGGNDSHTDNSAYGTFANRFAAGFDREMRANIGYVNHIMQHAAFFSEGVNFGLFDDKITWSKHRFEDTNAWPNNKESGETRLKTFRRLAAAYATHGTPLSYNYMNREELEGKRVYFRAVDTAGLGTSGVGAKSDKVLLNLVNFENQPVRMKVQVQMPAAAIYAGERFGAGDTYMSALSTVSSMQANPWIELDVELGKGETVQYILHVKENEAPTVPGNPNAAAVSYKQVNVAWNASSDNKQVAGYRIYRNGVHHMTVAGRQTNFTDVAVTPETDYTYQLEAYDESGNVSGKSVAAVTRMPVMPITPGGPKYEAEAGERGGSATVYNDAGASGGKGVGGTHGGSISLLNVDAGEGGAYVLTMRYTANGDSSKGIAINEERVAGVKLPSTGGWAGSNKYQDVKVNILLKPGRNIININPEGGGADIDYFVLEPGVYVPQPKWIRVDHGHGAVDYSAPTFAASSGGDFHETVTMGDSATLYFRGTGIRWFSKIQSDMGVAEVYMDGKLVATIDIKRAGLEGFNRLIFEKQQLTDEMHSVKVVSKEGKVAVYGFEYLGFETSPPLPNPDMIVTDVIWSPEFPKLGDEVTLSAVIKNIGSRPTPAGTVTGGVFSVAGGVVAWTDTYKNAIQPGDSVTLTANGGPAGSGTWNVAALGNYGLSFYVNDIGRYGEVNRENNKLEETIYAGEPAIDLVVSEVEWSPAAPGIGSKVLFSAKVRNQGNSPVAEGTITTIAFSVNGQKVSGFSLFNKTIASGETVTISAAATGSDLGVWTPSATGLYQVTAEVNGSAEVKEANVKNNQRSEELIVTEKPADAAAPVTTVSSTGVLGAGMFNKEAIELQFTAEDGVNGSGVESIHYRWNQGAWLVASGPVAVTQDGSYRLDYYSEDMAGNVEAIQSVEFAIDRMAPGPALELQGTKGAADWYISSVNAVLTATDSTSGVGKLEYQVSTVSDTTYGAWKPYQLPVTLSDGMHEVAYKATDKAGNESSVQKKAVKVDTMKPVVSVLANGQPLELGRTFEDAVLVTFHAASTDIGSGIQQSSLTVNGVVYQQQQAVSFAGQLGMHQIQATAIDAAGNSTVTTITIHVTTSESSLSQLLDRYIVSGEVKGPLASQLSNKLMQVMKHNEKGHREQASKHLEDFLQHLNLPSMQQHVQSGAAAVLRNDAEWLLNAWK